MIISSKKISGISLKRYLLIVLVTLTAVNAFTQVKNLGLPYFKTYTPEDYKASKQNWMATQDKRGVLYFGNTMGVLEYDGHHWKLIPLSAKASAVRAVFADKNGRIYVGSTREIGYLAPDSIGNMYYVSLVNKIEKEKDRKFEGVNRIFEIGEKIYFTGNDYIFEYENNKITTHFIKDLGQTVVLGNRIFLRISKKGLFEWENGKLKQLPNGEKYVNTSLRTILPYDDKLLFVTMEDGLLLLDDENLKELKFPVSSFLKKHKIISAIKLNGGQYAFGLLSNGMILTNKEGQVLQHFDTKRGLQSDLILNILQTEDNDLWLCTGNGLYFIMSSLPLTKYGSNFSINSAVYSSLLHEDELYIASAVGLYKRKWSSFENHLNQSHSFSRIGEPVNVWKIDTLNGNILVGTTRGINQIIDGKIEKISMEPVAVWRFFKTSEPNLAIATTNKGLKLLEFVEKKGPKKSRKKKIKGKKKSKGKWVFKKDIKGFKEKCRHIEFSDNNSFWVTNKQGIYKVSLEADFDSVSVVSYNKNKGIQDLNNTFIFKLSNEIIIGTNDGLFIYNQEKDLFEKHDELNSLLGANIKIWLLDEDEKGNIWYKQQRKVNHTGEDVFEMGQLIKQDNGSYLNYKTPFYKFKNDIYSISPLNNENVIIGTSKGFIHYNPNIDKDYSKPYTALIRKVELIANDSLLFDGAFIDSAGFVGKNQMEIQTYKIPYQYNDLRFTFSAPFFDSPEHVLYKYYLEGNDEGWTDWKTKNFKEYSNLSAKNYVFRVKTINIYGIESEEAVYRFTILPPWYETAWAIAGYIILFVLLIWGIVRLSVRRLRKQKEYLEMVVEERTAEIRMKNTELEQQKEEIMTQRDEIEAQKDQLSEKNKNITASITYAKRIQEAMLPLTDRIDQSFDDYFILFKPRDIVSGDFYWFAQKNNKTIFTAVDCTGHGVPGAFMSMIGSEILTTIVNQGITIPAEILDYKNRYVRKALKQDQTDNQDGMDMSLCTIDKQNKLIEWAGAKNPLVYIKNNEMFHVKGDSQSIGGHQLVKKKRRDFSNHEISYADGATNFYIFTDGFQDQFGGSKNRKFMVKRMKELIYENHKKPMEEQKKILNLAIEEWMKSVEQTDDILVIGFKLSP